MSFRTRAHRTFRQQQWSHVVDIMKNLAAERGPSVERPTVKFSASPDPTAPGLTPEEVAQLADKPVQYMMAREIGMYLPMVGRLHAQIMRTDDRLGFITCDDPCVWMTTKGAVHRPPTLNELSDEFGIFMPLSPAQMLFLNPYEAVYGRVPERLATWLKGQTWRGSEQEYVVCRNETREEWFAEEQDIGEI